MTRMIYLFYYILFTWILVFPANFSEEFIRVLNKIYLFEKISSNISGDLISLNCFKSQSSQKTHLILFSPSQKSQKSERFCSPKVIFQWLNVIINIIGSLFLLYFFYLSRLVQNVFYFHIFRNNNFMSISENSKQFLLFKRFAWHSLWCWLNFISNICFLCLWSLCLHFMHKLETFSEVFSSPKTFTQNSHLFTQNSFAY